MTSWVLYIAVFHYLANLPVDAPMPRGVLARFWMQVSTQHVQGFVFMCVFLLAYDDMMWSLEPGPAMAFLCNASSLTEALFLDMWIECRSEIVCVATQADVITCIIAGVGVGTVTSSLAAFVDTQNAKGKEIASAPVPAIITNTLKLKGKPSTEQPTPAPTPGKFVFLVLFPELVVLLVVHAPPPPLTILS